MIVRVVTARLDGHTFRADGPDDLGGVARIRAMNVLGGAHQVGEQPKLLRIRR